MKKSLNVDSIVLPLSHAVWTYIRTQSLLHIYINWVDLLFSYREHQSMAVLSEAYLLLLIYLFIDVSPDDYIISAIVTLA